jgi:hypothetical protein
VTPKYQFSCPSNVAYAIPKNIKFQGLVKSYITFYIEELLTLWSVTKLEDHPLLSAHDCTFVIFGATFHILRAVTSISNLRMCHDVIAMDPPNDG